MKINVNTRYPHPVLTEATDDYLDSRFGTEFQYREEGRQLIIESKLELENEFINSMIRKGKAKSGYYIICRETYFNHLQTVPLGASEICFDRCNFFKRVIIRPLIWSQSNIYKVKSNCFNKEFGSMIKFPKGTLLAIGTEYQIKVEPLKQKPLESIFLLSRNDDLERGTFKVDIDAEKISILVNSKTLHQITKMRESDVGRKLLVNTLFFPVVIELIAQLRDGASNYEDRLWFNVFSEKCKELRIEVTEATESPLEVAQTLLECPLRNTFDVMEIWDE